MDSNKNWREELYVMIFQSDTKAGRRFDGILLLIILASLVIVMLDSIDTVHRNYADVLAYIEWGFTVIFAIEYGLRLYCSPKPLRYAFSFYGLVDLVDAVEHHDHQAGQDDQQQDAVKAPSGRGVTLENHDVEPLAPVVVAVHNSRLKLISSKPTT